MDQVKIEIKIQKDGKIIEKTVSMQKDSVTYFLAALQSYGWKIV